MKIALLGTHSKSRMKAPFNDPDWLIWPCSPGNMNILPRFDAWFEVHDPAKSETRPDDYMEYLASLPTVYMRDRSGHPNALAYPEAEMYARFCEVPPGETEPVPFFFTSSPAFMFAYAITLAPEAIGLWGIHAASHEEFAYQRPGLRFFIQEAWGAGIEVIVPKGVTLLQKPKDRW